MSTKAKITIGYTNHMNEWIPEETHMVWHDGYPEHILPLLQEDLDNVNDFEELEDFYDGVDNTDYIYYIDNSNTSKVKCTVIGVDWAWFRQYGVDNYEIVKELIL